MATAGQLIDRLVEVSGLPIGAIRYPYRVLRDAGHVSKGKRGRGGAAITARDCAHVMLGVASTMPARDVAQSFETCSALTAEGFDFQVSLDQNVTESMQGQWPHELGVTGLSELSTGHTLADALEVLILAFRDGGHGITNVEMTVVPTKPYAHISVEVGMGAERSWCIMRYKSEENEQMHMVRGHPATLVYWGEEWRINWVTLDAIGELLR